MRRPGETKGFGFATETVGRATSRGTVRRSLGLKRKALPAPAGHGSQPTPPSDGADSSHNSSHNQSGGFGGPLAASSSARMAASTSDHISLAWAPKLPQSPILA